MRIARVLGVIGRLVRLFSIGFIPPLLLALYDGAESGQALAEATPFLIALPATFFGGWILTLGFQKGIAFRRAEALSVVAGSWLIIAHFAAIPYLFSGLHYTDALFESMSGFTTTGATILTDFSIHTRSSLHIFNHIFCN